MTVAVYVTVNDRTSRVTTCNAEGLKAFVRGLHLGVTDAERVDRVGDRYRIVERRTGRVIATYDLRKVDS